MITVTGYDGGINFINDNLQDITLTSLERIGVKRYQNDHVTSINKINGETYFGTLSGYLFTLDNELKIDNLIYLDDKIRDVLSKQDKNIVITSKNYLEINNNLEIIFSEKLPANGLTCGVYNDDNSLLISFFDKSLYSMSDRKFTKIKNFSKPLYNISSDNEHYYFAFGPTKNGRLMICDKKMDKKKKNQLSRLCFKF